MGIRHVSGISQWGGYQRAKLISDLRDLSNLEASEVAGRLGMSTTEVNRRYNAIKALQQMIADESFGDYASPHTYPIFHEALALPIVRAWLGWSQVNRRFENEQTREQFYELISPHQGDNNTDEEPKINSYQQVREFRYIIPNPDAKRILLDPSKSFIQALSVANEEARRRDWITTVTEACSALTSVSHLQLRGLDEDTLREIEKLQEATADLLDSYRRLTA